MELETRIDRLERALTRLAEAEARTEERVARLEDAFVRLTERVDRLAEGQARTESALPTLAQQVGRLSETIGFSLGDLARGSRRLTLRSTMGSTFHSSSAGSFRWLGTHQRTRLPRAR